jgi:hypothetical protein
MGDEKSILDATEYVLVALNNIKSYEDFNDYKEEIEKAVYDIRNSITNIINLKKNKNQNFNLNNNDNTSNKSSISSMLGLKFNYDAYLNDFNINNLNQNYFNIKNDNYNFNNNIADNINNNEEEENKNNINEELNEANNINKQNNIGLISFKDENTNFENQNQKEINDENNVIYNKSIRSKFKKSKNNINNIKKSNNKDIKINTKKSEKPIDIDKNITENKITNVNKSSPLAYRKEKLSLIADIIMKINSEDYFYEILTKLFGNDLTDKLMSSDVSDELLEAVQNSIKEIEELKNKDNLNEEQNNKNENINQDELEEEPRKFPSNEIMGPNIKDKNIKKNNKEMTNGKYQEFDFKKNLRKNENSEGKKPKGKNSNNNVKKEKPFISATSVYGNYFDPSLQKGGISKLDDYKK